MKIFMPVLLIFSMLLFLAAWSCTPVEKVGYRTVVSAKGFLQEEYRQHPECNVTSPAGNFCTQLARAVAAKDALIDAVELYCASPNFETNGGVCAPPPKGTPAYQVASEKLNAALSAWNQAYNDLQLAVKP